MHKYLISFTLILLALTASAKGNQSFKHLMRETSPVFFASDEARRIGDQLLLYQRVTGGWPKNIDMARPLSQAEKDSLAIEKNNRHDSTTDNNATNMQMTYLARLYQATGDDRYRDAFNCGLEYLLSGQYDNGGWPQFWPDPEGYQVHITYNDNAMVNTLKLFREIFTKQKPYDGKLVSKKMCKRLQKSFDKGIECILSTQIVTDGKPTVWCQQHDRLTYEPRKARSYELPSYCSSESVNIVDLLMQLPNPDSRVKAAVHGAMKWFDDHKITGVRIERYHNAKGEHDIRLIKTDDNSVLWARYYDLTDCMPYVCDRDGVPRYSLDSIGHERRNGYGWYNFDAASLYPKYYAWAEKYDPQNKVSISLNTPGFNTLIPYDIFSAERDK